jgi:hypothetical protein
MVHMSDVQTPGAVDENGEPVAPDAHVKIVYLGPTSPHWDFRSDFGDAAYIESFKLRVQARLLLLPPHDPQFRRNRERVNRDAERSNIALEWDLGYDEGEG